MTAKQSMQPKDRVLAGVLPALRRSAAKARDLARRTGTRLVVTDKRPVSTKAPKRSRPTR